MLLSCRLLICVSIFTAFLLAPSAFAGEADAGKECHHAGEQPDDQHPAEWCMPTDMVEDEEGKRLCEKKPSDLSVAVAITLILSFTFMISLQCFMNHHDVAMREYAYTVISSTVSIFSAVLTFQSSDGLVEDLISEPLKEATGLGEWIDVIVDLVHMLFWYAATQLTIAYVSGAVMSGAWRREQLSEMRQTHNKGHQTNVMLDVEINTVCYGITLAHLTGFAAINFWTGLQQMAPFKQSPMWTLVPLPFAVCAQLLLEKLTHICREKYTSLNGNKDWFETTWDEKCTHAEDDIMGLSLSVMIVNSVRYAVNASFGHKCLPNSEQKEEGTQCEFERSIREPLCLCGCGICFVILLFLTKMLFVKMSKEQLEMDATESKRIASLVIGIGMDMEENDEDEEETSRTCLGVFVERMEDVILTTWGMAHSWCVFHGTRQLVMVVNPQFLGKETNATTLAVVLACGVTYAEMALVRLLDVITAALDAAEWEHMEIEVSIKTVIRASSIFIGFAWEQTFDVSVDQLAQRVQVYGGPHDRAIAKLLIGSGCIGVVFCAWKWYILPFVFKKGWRYGYIFSRKDLKERCTELARHDKQFSASHLHEVATHLSELSEDHKERFEMTTLLHLAPRRSGLCRPNNAKHEELNYRSLPCNQDEAMRQEIQELRIHARRMEEQLEEEKKAGDDWKIHRRFLERQLAEQRQPRLDAKSSLESEVEPLRAENQELKIHTRYLEQQLVEERKAAEDWKIHRRYLERQLFEAREARLNGRTLPSGEVEQLHLEIQELKVHSRYLEQQLQEERAARLDPMLLPSSKVEPLQTEIDELQAHSKYLEQQLDKERETNCGTGQQDFEEEQRMGETQDLVNLLERTLENEEKAEENGAMCRAAVSGERNAGELFKKCYLHEKFSRSSENGRLKLSKTVSVRFNLPDEEEGGTPGSAATSDLRSTYSARDLGGPGSAEERGYFRKNGQSPAQELGANLPAALSSNARDKGKVANSLGGSARFSLSSARDAEEGAAGRQSQSSGRELGAGTPPVPFSSAREIGKVSDSSSQGSGSGRFNFTPARFTENGTAERQGLRSQRESGAGTPPFPLSNLRETGNGTAERQGLRSQRESGTGTPPFPLSNLRETGKVSNSFGQRDSSGRSSSLSARTADDLATGTSTGSLSFRSQFMTPASKSLSSARSSESAETSPAGRRVASSLFTRQGQNSGQELGDSPGATPASNVRETGKPPSLFGQRNSSLQVTYAAARAAEEAISAKQGQNAVREFNIGTPPVPLPSSSREASSSSGQGFGSGRSALPSTRSAEEYASAEQLKSRFSSALQKARAAEQALGE